jgi:hypothetical protein
MAAFAYAQFLPPNSGHSRPTDPDLDEPVEDGGVRQRLHTASAKSGPARLTFTFAKADIEIRLIDHGLVGTELLRR